jgi:Rho termination factor, N-terminal domain
VNRRGADGRWSIPDIQPEATIRDRADGEHDGENGAHRAARSAVEDLGKKWGDYGAPKDAKGRSEAKAARNVGKAHLADERSSRVDASKSKSELYREAKKAGIEGRSAMNKEQLIEALRKHRATTSPREPPSQPPGGRVRRRSQARSEAHASMSEVDSAEAVPPAPTEVGSAEALRPADARRPDRCAIVYKASGRYGEFQVVVAETGGSQRSVARSPSFRGPGLRPLRPRGPARVAHEVLVSRLEACGWRPVDSAGPWHELGLIRLADTGMRSRHSLVTVVRERGQARFVAEELDTYGNPTPLTLSAPFRAPRFFRVRASSQARAALRQLVRRMESEGWNVAAAVGNEPYAISLWRPSDTNCGPLGPRAGAGHRGADPA